MKNIEFNFSSKDIRDLMSLFEDNRLNLEPGFQRQSVWTVNDRKKLILSIIQNYPVPSVFLYKTTDERGRLKYDVLDGKQRLESVFMFAGLKKFRGQGFNIKAALGNEEDKNQEWNWGRLRKYRHEHLITGYKVQIVEVSGSLSDIIGLFERINSTGKRLTSQEKRHARHYHSNFLKTAGQLAKRYQTFFSDNRILTKGQLARMKHVELVCELLASLHMQQLLNKKNALDKIISGGNINERQLAKCRISFVHTLNLLKKMFPQFKTTRFAYSAEFYSLFMLVWEMDKDKLILTDPKRNRQAQQLLTWMSNGVDALRVQMSKAQGARPDQQLFAAYLFTTRGDSDSSTTRKRRAETLHQLFKGLFEKKDDQRMFSREQRRLFWNSDAMQSCRSCGTKLSWENFTLDHVHPHALGGPSELKNAALLCRNCNSRKGKKSKQRR